MPKHEAAARPRRPAPRVSMRTRLMIWTVVLVSLPVLLCAVALKRITHAAFQQSQVRTAELVAHSLASSLSGRMAEPWSPAADRVVEAVSEDPRVALVVVTTPGHRPLHQRMSGAQELASIFGADFDPSDFYLDVGRTRHLGPQGQLTLLQHPVWAPYSPDSPPKLEGYVLVGLYDREMLELMRFLGVAQVVVVLGTMALALPMIWIAVNRWTRPIRKMASAAYGLASGRRVKPVPAHRRDEIGLLGEAFNHMAVRLNTAHEQLRIHNDYLEEIVTQRTAELEDANRQLADQVEQSKSFIRTISHDLVAPLRNIDGMASLLIRRHGPSLSEDALHKLERITANVRIQNELIRDLVETSRQRHHQQRRRDAQPVEVRQVIDRVAAAMSHDLEAAGVELRIEGAFPVLHIEASRLLQVFQNLIDNAVKYMADAPRRVVIVRGDRQAGAYRFSVSDTGPGIAAEDIPLLFETYQRAGQADNAKVQGNGVGLATVKMIVQSYGGEVGVESQVGQGSTFAFTLPATMEAAVGVEG